MEGKLVIDFDKFDIVSKDISVKKQDVSITNHMSSLVIKGSHSASQSTKMG